MASEAATDEKHSFGSSIYVAFVPWILFSVISEHGEIQAATVLALGAAILICGSSIRAGHPKSLEIGTVLAFVALAAVALASDDATREWLVRYGRAVSTALLALIAFASLLRTPFTEQYARESVPEQFWSSPRFKEINRKLTLVWGFVFLLMVPSHIAAGAINTHRAMTFFNWVIPIGLVVFAIKTQGKLTEEDDASSAQGDPPGSASAS